MGLNEGVWMVWRVQRLYIEREALPMKSPGGPSLPPHASQTTNDHTNTIRNITDGCTQAAV